MSDRKDASKRKRRGTGPCEGWRGEREVVLKKQQSKAMVEDGRSRPCQVGSGDRIGGADHIPLVEASIAQAAPLEKRREEQ